MAGPKFSLDASMKALENIANENKKDLVLAFKIGPGGGWSVSLGSHDKRNYEHLAWDESLPDTLKSAIERHEAKKLEKGAVGRPKPGI